MNKNSVNSAASRLENIISAQSSGENLLLTPRHGEMLSPKDNGDLLKDSDDADDGNVDVLLFFEEIF